jgi:D-alanyl-D-alanine carboxypeptidase/D-alanyl-D-alanine-endopeptidase (penicillin-binding protein 4)
MGAAPAGLAPLATVRSAPLATLLERQNHDSINFYAEMLAKALGAVTSGAAGSTANGASAIERWVAAHGVRARVLDGSGLSHLDRTSASGVVTLLLGARHEPWFRPFLASLPRPGEGTLERRLAGVSVRAKTGSLFVTPASTLSGYVRDAAERAVAFSILTRGMGPGTAIAIEDAIVRLLAGARVV